MKDDLNNRFGAQEGRRIVEALSRGDKAYIERAAQLNPTAIRVQTFTLTTAPTNPVSVGFAFKSVYVVAASDAGASISLKPFSDSDNNDYVPLALKDVLAFDQPVNKCFINWTSQSGKTITVVFFTDAKFTSGSFVNESTSSLDGNSINDYASIAVSTTLANLVDNTSRNVISIVNNGPDAGYVGGSGVLATPGSEKGYYLSVGSTIIYNNSAAIYFASQGTSNLMIQTES